MVAMRTIAHWLDSPSDSKLTWSADDATVSFIIIIIHLQLHDDCSNYTADAFHVLDTQKYAQSFAFQGQCGRCDFDVYGHLYNGSLFAYPALRAHRQWSHTQELSLLHVQGKRPVDESFAVLSWADGHSFSTAGSRLEHSLREFRFINYISLQELDVGLADGIRVLNITHTGELGYVLYIPNEYALHVYSRLHQAGQKYNIQHAGAFLLWILSSALSIHLHLLLYYAQAIMQRVLCALRSSMPFGDRIWIRLPHRWNVDAVGVSSLMWVNTYTNIYTSIRQSLL